MVVSVGKNGLGRDVFATPVLQRRRKKPARSRAQGMMLEEVEGQGRRFRFRHGPMVKVKQWDLSRSTLSPSRSLLVISRQLMLSTLTVSAVDVRLETPIDEAEARLGGVSQLVGHRPLSRSIPFQVPSWSFLERQYKLHSLSCARRYVPGRATYCWLPSVCRLLPRA